MKTVLLLLIVAFLLVLSSLGNSPSIQSSFAASDTKPAKQSIATQVAASDWMWRDVDPKSQAGVRIRQQHGPRTYRSMRLDTLSFRTLLRQAPLESRNSPVAKDVVLSLPLPDGGFTRFNIEDSPIMEESLARRYPEIKTYRGQGIDDPTATVRFDWTQFGFHAMILSTRGTVLIEPDTFGDVSNYVVYAQQQIRERFSVMLIRRARKRRLANMNISRSFAVFDQTYFRGPT